MRGGGPGPPRSLKMRCEDSESSGRSPRTLPIKGKAMQLKKTQITPKHDGLSPRVGATSVRFGKRRGRQSLVADLRIIISAAQKLPAEVAPPPRVWRSLRAQLENEGILSRTVKSRLEEQTRFPMFSN